MERSSPGRIGTTLLPLDVPESELPDSEILREELEMPEVSEGDLVRYFSQISQFNFSIDHNFYPLGSCTIQEISGNFNKKTPPCSKSCHNKGGFSY